MTSSTTSPPADIKNLKPLKGLKKLLQWDPKEWKSWELCPSYFNLIGKTNLLPIKPPLSTAYEIHYQDKAVFTPSDFIESLVAKAKEAGQEALDIGLVIDATGNDFYYHDIKEWEDWDVEYQKLPLFEQAVPTDEALEDFSTLVDKYLKAEDGARQIAVFSRNGYNHSGYLIIGYMIESCNMKLDEALKLFQQTCPPGIYSHECLTMLYKKYHSVLSSKELKCPQVPSWDHQCYHQADSTPGIIGPECLSDTDRANVFQRKKFKNDTRPAHSDQVAKARRLLPPPPTFSLTMNAKVEAPVAAPPIHQRRRLRAWKEDDVSPLKFGKVVPRDSKQYQDLCNLVKHFTGIEDYFPGTEATSLSASHIGAADMMKKGSLNSSYFVTWRARGHRCIMVLISTGTFLLLRDMSFVEIPNMYFPRRKSAMERLDNTIIDGILVQDHDQNNVVVDRYLAFDILVIEGSLIWKRGLEKRLQVLQNEVVLPKKQDTHHQIDQDPFRIRMKDQFRIGKTEHVLNRFIPKITHSVEGLIFTPLQAPYGLGGYEAESPVFKFIGSEKSAISFDGSLPESKLLAHIERLK